jgi:hypothetical protein
MDEGTVDWWLNLWRKWRELWRPCLWQEIEEIKNKTQIRLYFEGTWNSGRILGVQMGALDHVCGWCIFSNPTQKIEVFVQWLLLKFCRSWNHGIWDLRYVSKTWIWFCGWLIILVTPFLERALDALLVQEQTYMEWSFTLICLLSFNTEILLTLDFIINFSWIVSDDMTESSCLSQVFAKMFCLKFGEILVH